MQVEKFTAEGFDNDTIKQKISKAINMQFYWIKERTRQSTLSTVGLGQPILVTTTPRIILLPATTGCAPILCTHNNWTTLSLKYFREGCVDYRGLMN